MSRKKIVLIVVLLAIQFLVFYAIGSQDRDVLISSTSSDALRQITVREIDGGVSIAFRSEEEGEASGSMHIYRSMPLSKDDISIAWDSAVSGDVHITKHPEVHVPVVFTATPDTKEANIIQSGNDGSCQYRILNDVVELSFDAGTTWKKTPIPADKLQIYASPKSNRLGTESYQISPELTVFQFVNSTGHLVSMSSVNEGSTWSTQSSTLGPYQTSSYTMKFQDQMHGYVFYVQFVGLQYFESEDGGATWTENPIQNPNEQAIMIAAVAIDDMLLVSNDDGSMYQSSDKGLHFQRIDVPKDFPLEELRNIQKEGTILSIDAWKSNDQGITWTQAK